MSQKLSAEFFQRDTLQVAQELLGKYFIYQGCGGQIMETEAYHESEAACHAYRGKQTQRNAMVFYPGGYLYIYRIHQVFCLNITTEAQGTGCAVLIRAFYPTQGLEAIRERRNNKPFKQWTNGPGKICKALDMDLRQNGLSLLNTETLCTVEDRGVIYSETEIEQTSRIGISKAQELLWRFNVMPLYRKLGLHIGNRDMTEGIMKSDHK